MPELYLIIVVLLFILAASDLVVGVSNDAVNFLNSAIGSRVAPRRIIMIVASAGILVGATFSSGMMEVARKGIFNPQYFVFAEIMIIFLAVMLTDIILLDFFNTFGLPTSTTVSIVFELLGASVIMALIKVSAQGQDWSAMADYINSSSALAIIAGIFLSVGVAFTVGVLIQYFSRLLFTFHYQKRMRIVGVVWSGLALALLTYFLLIKGLKGASFVSTAFVDWTKHNTWLLLLGSFVFWTVVMQVLLSVFKVNILRLIVLFGTFALAMAFAGNDLVNFIGVPIAGFESYNAWSASGESADTFSMGVLQRAVRTKTYLLLAAGIIMIVTLWLSRKARSVTETEVNLGRQSEGLERFSPNALSRGIVRFTRNLGIGMAGALPNSWLEKAESSFEATPEKFEKGKEYDPPAFDLVRASVNLTVASALIALATSYKLPLSTTYVSFMVAMGTSLADRAWGRDSAVYRVAGVLNVIGGWFATALIAFTVSGSFAFLIHRFGVWAIGILVLLAITLIARSFAYHRKKEKEKEKIQSFQRRTDAVTAGEVVRETAGSTARTLRTLGKAYSSAIEGLLQEDRALLQQAVEEIKRLKRENEEFKYKFFGDIRRIEEEHTEGSRTYLLVYDLEQDIIQSAEFVVEATEKHVANVLSPLAGSQSAAMEQIAAGVRDYLDRTAAVLEQSDFSDFAALIKDKQHLFLQLEELLGMQVNGIKTQRFGARNSLLFFSLLLESKDIVAVTARFTKLYHRLQQPADPLLLVGNNGKG